MKKTISDWIKDNAHSGIKIKLGFIPSTMNGPASVGISMIFDKFPIHFENSPRDLDYVEVSNTSYIDYTNLSDKKIVETLNAMYERGLKQRKSINDKFGY